MLLAVQSACADGDSEEQARGAPCDVFRPAEAERLLGGEVHVADFEEVVAPAAKTPSQKEAAAAAAENICTYTTGAGEPREGPLAAFQQGPNGFTSTEQFYDGMEHSGAERVAGLGTAAVFQPGATARNQDGSMTGNSVTVLLQGGRSFTVAAYNADASRAALVDVAAVIARRL